MSSLSDMQTTHAAKMDFVHTGPGTLAGRYLRMFWQPVCAYEELKPGYAVPIRIMREDFTLYRGESGVTYIVDFRCAHRGTQLSLGWVEQDCIRCFYHGWKYDGSGQCVEQPAEDKSFAQKIKIRSYPTYEYLGLIFAYLGDEAAPPFPRYSELEEEGVIDVGSYVRYCNYFNTLENGIDQAHVPFTHAKSNFTKFGLNWDIPKITAEETEYGIAMYGTRSNGIARVNHYLMPNILYIKGSPESSKEGWREAFAGACRWTMSAIVASILPWSMSPARRPSVTARGAGNERKYSPNSLTRTRSRLKFWRESSMFTISKNGRI